MLVVKLWNYFRGYVVFRLEGLNLERVINLAISRGVYFWDIHRIDYTTIEAKVGIEGYKELRNIIKKTGCRAKISMKIGYPFVISNLKRRKVIIIGWILSLMILIISSSFIWSIDVVGNKKINDEEILKTLRNLGLNQGIFKYKVNIDNIKNNLLIKYDTISWVGIEIKGTKAIVKIIERDDNLNKIESNIPCDIVADKRGIIEKVIAKNGDAVVKRGDIVKPNQVLISGKIVREGMDVRYVHSLGEVYARTFYEKVEKRPIYNIIKIKTGKKYTRRIIRIGNMEFTISKGNVPFKKYVVEKKNKSFSKWRKINIPIEILIENYYQIVEKKQRIDEKILRKSLENFMIVNIMKEIPKEAKILNKTFKFKRENNIFIARLTVECLESIGVKKRINIVEED
ncbi:sporulation protein YqfD [Caminicella sporogenes]|uniref:sporulation protein YqfD n=1 Tax=Caminicella sporogenes TaxID=166485 RepID=UPI00254164F1|nr:sporulation protein YqfD [Caminicella sporogenes]WIF94798.1 sporulation protein YqfD [Caminicella sporogenes]